VTTIRVLADKLDKRLGDGLERLLCAHHARRLRRLGWAGVLEGNRPDRWFAEGATVHQGNRIEVLIDGEQALPAIRTAIEGATSRVHVANWYASPDFRLTREPGAPTLRALLATAAQRVPVRLLLWAGPPLPAFQPTRAMVKSAQREFTRDSTVRCVLDARERTLHCHHEKLVIVDETTAFVGGIDFTALQGDRHDTRRRGSRRFRLHRR
jgi:phosphatidylserine/phosphatidylglycerophosphate/cardiolipin synthase-like enzyme